MAVRWAVVADMVVAVRWVLVLMGMRECFIERGECGVVWCGVVGVCGRIEGMRCER